ncbi:MAG: DUF5808 domain-containing protein [Thermaerobacter sp.]|nr:DUF5808 domain-containing protein [Thermaerobacter sp.]
MPWANVGTALAAVLLCGIYWVMPDLQPATLPFGVRVPPERARDAAVLRVRRGYRWGLLLAGLAALGTGWATFHRPADFGWTVAVLAAAEYLDFYLAFRRLGAVKRREGWYAGVRQGAAAVVETRPLRLAPWWGVPAAVVILATLAVGLWRYPDLPPRLPVAFGLGGQPRHWLPTTPMHAFFPVLEQALLTALLGGLAWVILRVRQELDPSDPEGSAHRQRSFRRIMAAATWLLAALGDVTLGIMALRSWGMLPGAAAAAAGAALFPSLMGGAGMTILAVRTGQGGSRLAAPAGSATGLVHRDDDRFWKGGVIYWNPHDAAVFVMKRFGVGWTLNFARPAAWLLLIGVLALALLPLAILRR